MQKILILIFLTAVILYNPKQVCSIVSNVYTVSSSSNQCPDGIPNCHELSFYIRHISWYFTSNTEFRFLSGTHILSNTPVPVSISGISNIAFTGQATDTPIIQCSDGSHGFAFQSSSNITLRSLRIEGCTPTTYAGALTVKDSHSLTLEHLTITNTTTFGLFIYNVDVMEITHSNFSNNGLGISNCSLKMFVSSYSVIAVTNYVKEVNYTITDTVFNGNTVESSNQLGGGFFCYIINTRTTVVTLKNTTFRGINSCSFKSAVATIFVENYSLLANITVNDSMFINNYQPVNISEGALIISAVAARVPLHATSNIVIANSIFAENTGIRSAGAVITSFNSLNSHIQVIESTFKANEVIFDDTDRCVVTVSGLLIYLVMEKSMSPGKITVDVTNNTFVGNIGGSSVLEIWPSFKNHATCKITVNNSTFLSNTNIAYSSPQCPMISSSIVVYFKLFLEPSSKVHATITIDSCHIQENTHGVTFLNDLEPVSSVSPLKSANKFHYAIQFKLSNCVFKANTMGLYIDNTKYGIQNNLFITSCTFYNHDSKRTETIRPAAVIDISCVPSVYIENIIMANNEMTPICIKDSGLQFKGFSLIENNTALLGGGIHIRGTGYAFMYPYDTALVFKNNKAIYGGALYSEITSLLALYQYHELTNARDDMSYCTFLGLNTAAFINNTASIAGDNMYGGVLGYCELLEVSSKGLGSVFVNLSFIINCPSLSSPNGLVQSTPSSVSSDPFSVLLCEDKQRIQPDKRNTTVKLLPGQSINVTVSTTGHCNGFSPGFLNVSALTKGVEITENDVQGQEIDHPCRTLSFKPLISQTNHTKVEVEISIAHTRFIPVTNPFKVIVNVLSCPHGMFLESKAKSCQCNSSIVHYVQQCNVFHAPNPFIKTINMNNWMTYNEGKQCITIAPICPFDYCSLSTDIYFNLDNTTDYQCSNNRTGTLCGQCQPGLSQMFGSNRCEHCSNYYLLLLLVFSVAGILLIILIIFLNMTISVGMLNGLLFYANIVKLNETQLFPNDSIPVISQFISWLNLDFGIELCFFNGLDGYWKTWLQFAFPLYLWLVTIGIILYSKYSIKFSRYLPTNIISVLATLILVSFTKLLRTVTAVFMATRLQCGTRTELVWSVDGSIEYWSIRHSLLMGFGVVVLMLVAVYTLLLLFFQCLQRASNYRVCRCLQHILFRIHPFIDAYSGPFVPRYGYWTGVLVLIRIIVTVVFAYTSGSADYINNYIIVIIEVVIYNVFHSGYYQSKLNFYCERFFHINLCAVCLINALMFDHSTPPHVAIATMTSVTLSILMFIAIVTWHFYKLLSQRCRYFKECQLQPADQSDESSDDNYSPSVPICRRDSIIFDFNKK